MTGGPQPPPDASVALAPGLVVADRFRLIRPLGQGGMGAVWAAQHTELETPCALKFMLEGATSAEIAARFKREAKAAALLRSPHVVQILDHGVWRDVPYIAMELLEGEDLHRRLKRLRALAPGDVVSIAAQVGRALAKAHAAGLVHRDLKPANIFLARDDEREIAKVLDFGVAKVTTNAALSEAKTTTGAVLGTPFYMSPEHLRGEKTVDHRADLWALSVVVYQCLVGRLPFRGDALAELIIKIMMDPIPVPSQVAPERALPATFDAWWARAVDRDISKRFQTAKDLTEALALALGVSLGPALGTASGRLTVPDAISGAFAPKAGAPAPAPPMEELDSGLLHTAMPTVTPSPMGSGQLSAQLPPALRRKSPARILVPIAALVAGGIAALVAFRGHEPPAAGVREDVSSATAVTMGTAPPNPGVATPAPSASATATASAAASASAPPAAEAKAARATPPPSPPPAVARPAAPAKPRSKHEGVTDF